MNLALQRRRLVIAMTITVVALVVAMAAVVASFGFHQAWGAWVFVLAILAGFASHGWLMLGVLREKSPQ
jgi:Na+/H+-dicarboxylate symporter